MAAADMYVTPTGAGTKSGADWANAFGLAEWETDVEVNCEAGDRYFVAGGTYTLTNAFSTALDGTKTDPIKIIGVKSGTTNEPPTASDYATGTDRPLISCGSYYFWLDDYWQVENIRFSGAYASTLGLVKADTGARFINCDIVNTTASANMVGLYVYNASTRVIDCKIKCTNGIGLSQVALGGLIDSCYFYDSVKGIDVSARDYCAFLSCIFDGCTTGLNIDDEDGHIVRGCTFYNCTTAISGSTGGYAEILNNIFDSNTTAISWSTTTNTNHLDYNNYYNNGTDVSGVTKGGNATAYDPQFEDAANDDFRLASGSQCRDAGFGIRLGTGGNATDVDQGAPQHADAAGGAAIDTGPIDQQFVR